MWRTQTYEDAAPASAANGSEHTRREPARAGTLTLIARAAAHDRISAALRSARERAGLDEQQVIDLMRARGVSISVRRSSGGSAPAGSGWRRPSIWPPCTTCRSTNSRAGGRRHGRFLGSVERTRLDA